MNKVMIGVIGALWLTACGARESDDPDLVTMTEVNDPLAGTEWWIEDIGGTGVVDRSRSTVAFSDTGRVAGNAGCNQFTGTYRVEGDSLRFGALAGTMMACPEALMNQERRFHAAMAEVRSWSLDRETDLLFLRDESGTSVLRASRIEPAPNEAGNDG